MTLNELEEVLGVAGTQALIKRRGGTRVRIPKRPVKPGHWLCFLGLDPANRLVEAFGGEEVDIPVGQVYKNHARQKRLIELCEQGYSLNQIARAAGLHRRTVTNHIGKPLDPNQISFLEDDEQY